MTLVKRGRKWTCDVINSHSPGTFLRSYHGYVEHHKKLAILVGGGPAPGINAVIGAATIRAALEGIDVMGVRDGSVSPCNTQHARGFAGGNLLICGR